MDKQILRTYNPWIYIYIYKSRKALIGEKT